MQFEMLYSVHGKGTVSSSIFHARSQYQLFTLVTFCFWKQKVHTGNKRSREQKFHGLFVLFKLHSMELLCPGTFCSLELLLLKNETVKKLSLGSDSDRAITILCIRPSVIIL